MRTSGILMPVFSLPSPYGIGTLGQEAYNFVDFLEKAGQTYWQILPLNPTNYGDSPYQSFSSYAGNPYFIDPDILISEGLLTKAEVESYDFGNDSDKIDYGKLYENRILMLKKAFDRFSPDDEYKSFTEKNSHWLEEYALFMALKNAHNDEAWSTWEEELRLRDANAIMRIKQTYQREIEMYRFIQFKFSQQWSRLKKYANDKGVYIIGDIPIYVAYDSADVWSQPDQFMLDQQLKPTRVAGCPPDAFSDEGQLWGNPLYNWKKMKSEGFSWWKKRLGHALDLYDLIRIDHFRGFESFYAIPFGDDTAKNGKWLKGPDMALFKELKKEFGEELPIIAEDLGFLTSQVLKMLKLSGFPGIKVLQFAFTPEEDNDYLPHNYSKNCVVYTGTHDNDTIIGWAENSDKDTVKMAKDYLRAGDKEGFNWTMIKAAMMSVADVCILMMPDFMGLGSEARINIPSTVGGNWQWRIDKACLNDWLAGIIYDNTARYFRLPANKSSVK